MAILRAELLVERIMVLDIVICFFLLGLFAGLVRSDLRLPSGLYDTLTILLLLAIGLKGGIELSKQPLAQLWWQGLVVMALGALLALLAFPLLRLLGRFGRADAAAIAAHYGSVSVATFAVALAFLDRADIPYESHVIVFLVLMEMPAIAVGILLAKGIHADRGEWGRLLHEVFLNKGLLLMGGGLVIGAVMGEEGSASVKSLFVDLFKGILALFLVEMGLVVADRIADLRRCGLFLLGFGVAMPLLGAAFGLATAQLLGLSAGGAALLATLAASASYIAVPAAMRIAVPEANHGVAIAASLGITFPFNVAVGIALYTNIAQRWIG